MDSLSRPDFLRQNLHCVRIGERDLAKVTLITPANATSRAAVDVAKGARTPDLVHTIRNLLSPGVGQQATQHCDITKPPLRKGMRRWSLRTLLQRKQT